MKGYQLSLLFSVPCFILSLMLAKHVTPYNNDGQCRRATRDQFSKCVNRSSCWFFSERQPYKLKGYKRVKYCATPGTPDSDDDPMICCPKPAPRIPQTVTDIVNQKCEEYAKSLRERSQVTCGMNEQNVRFLAHGTRARATNFLHMVRIGKTNGHTNYTIRWFCSGTLISERFVLSAAHCVENTTSKNELQVGLITMYNKQYTRPTIFGVAESIIHPNYDIGMKYQNDVALLRLNSIIELDIDVRPICLPVSSDSLDDLKKVTIAGWGETDTNTSKENINVWQTWGTGGLLEGSMCLSYGNMDCDKKSPNFNITFNSSSMICAVSCIGANNSHTCSGDSGGPAQIYRGNCSWTQVGITAYGNNLCGDNSIPTVFTKISHYIEWIQKIVWP